MKSKLIVIVGPTSSGKSSLGVLLAKKLGGEVISADSRQVYRGLNFGTGKVTKKEMQGVPHHLLDVASPKKQFSVDDFVRLARGACSNIVQHNKIPIVVGGTGLYADVLLGRISIPEVPPNPALRARLEKLPVSKLFAMLKKLDPKRASNIEPKHKRRLIRAIEVAKARGTRPKAMRRVFEGRVKGLAPTANNILWLGLYPGEQKLRENIHTRLLARMRAGMLTEARRLHTRGLSYKRMNELGLEYRSLAELLQGHISKEDMLADLERAIARYAKRQMRWFKRNKDIRWVSNEREALRLAREFMR